MSELYVYQNARRNNKKLYLDSRLLECKVTPSRPHEHFFYVLFFKAIASVALDISRQLCVLTDNKHVCTCMKCRKKRCQQAQT